MAPDGYSPSAKSTIVGGLQWMLVVALLAPPAAWIVARLVGTSDGRATFFPPVDLAAVGLLVVFLVGAAFTRQRIDSVAHERRVTRQRLGFIAGVLLVYLALDLLLSAAGLNGAAGQLAPAVAVGVGSLVVHWPSSGPVEMRGR